MASDRPKRVKVSQAVVLHVLPRDLARGAQVFARALRDRLDDDAVQHRTVSLFEGPPAALDADHRLDRRIGPLRRLGFDPRVVLRLRRLVAEVRPGVLVAHGGESLKYCAAAQPAGSKLVYHRIGTNQRGLTGLRLALHRRLVRSADLVVAVSEDVADEVVSVLGADPARTVVIPNGRDPDRYRPADHDGPDGSDGSDGSDSVAGTDVRLAFVGHMAPTKRPLQFVEIVRRAAGSVPGVTAVMAAAGRCWARSGKRHGTCRSRCWASGTTCRRSSLDPASSWCPAPPMGRACRACASRVGCRAFRW